jgi:hypothetical protein
MRFSFTVHIIGLTEQNSQHKSHVSRQIKEIRSAFMRQAVA